MSRELVSLVDHEVIVWSDGKIVMLWSVTQRSSVGLGYFEGHACLWLLYLKISGMAPQSISFSSGFPAYNALKSTPS
jgi:hypothetical protein